jgi:hypothetical protein
MLTHMVISYFFLMLISLLLEADAHVGSVRIELAERKLEDPLKAVHDEEQQNQTLHLLQGMGSLVTLCLSAEILLLILAHEDERQNRECRESLLREMCRVYLL